jgi:hypothetical protein
VIRSHRKQTPLMSLDDDSLVLLAPAQLLQRLAELF